MNDIPAQLQIYSFGTVLEDKPKDTFKIKATIDEVINDLDGDLTTYKDTYSGSGPSIESSSYIEPLWLAMGNESRSTPPDVVSGEEVIIYRYSDSELYFWITRKQDLRLRRLEHIKHVYSNTPQRETDVNDNNSYYTIMSTRDKMISLTTSDNDGEAAKYEILIDTKKGTVSLTDNKSNQIILDSPKRDLTITTSNILFDCDTFRVTGRSQFDKTVNIDGNTSITPNLTVGGSASVSNNVSVGGTVSAGKVTSVAPISAPNV